MPSPSSCRGHSVLEAPAPQTAALTLGAWAEEGDKLTDAVARPLAAHLETRIQAATDPAKESAEGEAQTIAYLRTRLTCDRIGGLPDRSNFHQTGGREE